jgi:hypothetical protein
MSFSTELVMPMTSANRDRPRRGLEAQSSNRQLRVLRVPLRGITLLHTS